MKYKKFLTAVFILSVLTIFASQVRTNKVHADTGPMSWEILNNHDIKVIKLQDGYCTLYITYSKTNAIDPSRVAMVTGQGCK